MTVTGDLHFFHAHFGNFPLRIGEVESTRLQLTPFALLGLRSSPSQDDRHPDGKEVVNCFAKLCRERMAALRHENVDIAMNCVITCHKVIKS